MKRTQGRLALSRQSVRALSTDALAGAAGGLTYPGTHTSPSRCNSCLNDDCDEARTRYLSYCPCPYSNLCLPP